MRQRLTGRAPRSRPTRKRGPSFWAKSKFQRSSRTRSLPYERRRALLSRGEGAFFGPLCQAVAGRYLVMCKVRLADVVTCSSTDWRRGFGGAISQKHVDFVLCERGSTRFVIAIELDDRSHDRPDRRQRDEFLNRVLDASGVTLLRFKAQASYSIQDIRACLDEALAESTTLPT